MKKTLGQRVHELRMQKGLSVQELARMAEVSASYIYAIEAGARGSHIDKLTRIARILDTNLTDLWPGQS